jgi:hypothetical protein
MTRDSVTQQGNYAFFIQKLGRSIARCGLYLYELEVPDYVSRYRKRLRLGPNQTHCLRRCLSRLKV